MSKDYLEQLYSIIKEKGQLDESSIRYLERVFPEQKDKILEVLKKKTTKYTYIPSNKVIWMVMGENQKEYLLYPRIYCSCQDFYKNTVIKKKRPYCKHLVAQVISEALGMFNEKEKEDTKFNLLIDKLKLEF
ncbi:MAG: SWIM zinc finger family protein [Candidatus Lokiarchaeota archaeon]|nr:SWIM zinc finger family protein [Candidatus Lokiarchaeota archaeon]